jgi:mannitol/fructose-specific phosphotransferase system IIA component (Ntr-type)
MKLASLLSRDQIILDLRSTDHLGAIEELVDRLVAIGRVPAVVRDEVLAALQAREDLVSTGVGAGVAIPHTLSDSLREVVAVFGRSRAGIEFAALDAAPVHFVVLFIVPRQRYALHLQTLAAIAKTFASRSTRQCLGAAESCEEILAVLTGDEFEPAAVMATAGEAPA